MLTHGAQANLMDVNRWDVKDPDGTYNNQEIIKTGKQKSGGWTGMKGSTLPVANSSTRLTSASPRATSSSAAASTSSQFGEAQRLQYRHGAVICTMPLLQVTIRSPSGVRAMPVGKTR